MPLPKEITPDIMALISLYNNAKDLIVISQKRKEANDVVRAASIYAQNIGIDLSDDAKDKIENFSAVLLDSRSNTLVHILQSIVQDIVTSEIAKSKKNKKS